jgi:hypothetical protein
VAHHEIRKEARYLNVPPPAGNDHIGEVLQLVAGSALALAEILRDKDERLARGCERGDRGVHGKINGLIDTQRECSERLRQRTKTQIEGRGAHRRQFADDGSGQLLHRRRWNRQNRSG